MCPSLLGNAEVYHLLLNTRKAYHGGPASELLLFVPGLLSNETLELVKVFNFAYHFWPIASNLELCLSTHGRPAILAGLLSRLFFNAFITENFRLLWNIFAFAGLQLNIL